MENKFYNLWVVFDNTFYEELTLPDKNVVRFDFGLPCIKEKILDENEFINYISNYDNDFVDKNIFSDKYLAYKRWQELLNKKLKEINKFLGE